jgi:hypothetical protein
MCGPHFGASWGCLWSAADELFSPFKAYGTVIVNHTAGVSELICSGANNVTKTGGIHPYYFLTYHGNQISLEKIGKRVFWFEVD